MSNTGKIWLLIAVIVFGAAAYFLWNGGVTNAPASPAGQSAANQPGASTGNSTSDTSLNQDLANLDTQINSFASDSATIDQSLNDQPVAQSQL